ncbi:MAG: polysaccharide deacetylase family protein [candidate division Zixibacteria bacterium]|nr:polysaccharide deacetylase family protein [candidate division Zixibacteria bacterium]
MADSGIILAFHQTSDKFYPGINNIRPHFFFAILDLLMEFNFGLRSESSANDRQTPKATITFDDAYEDNFPVLSALCDRGIYPSLFVPTDYIGTKNIWEYSARMFPARHLEAGQIRKLSDKGVIIGSHGASHRSFTVLDQSTRKAELDRSKRTLEDITGKQVDSISFPFGRFNKAIIAEARTCGFSRGYSLSRLPHVPDHVNPFINHRVAVYGNDDYYSLRRRLVKNSWWENVKGAISWRLAGGTTTIARRLK